jgi:hypothetical protein
MPPKRKAKAIKANAAATTTAVDEAEAGMSAEVSDAQAGPSRPADAAMAEGDTKMHEQVRHTAPDRDESDSFHAVY